MPANLIGQIINGKRSITGDTARRSGHQFGVESQFWLGLQAHLDLVRADKEAVDAIRGLDN